MKYFLSGMTLTVLWVALSGKFDAFHISLGVISILIVTFWTGPMLYAEKKRKYTVLGWVVFLLKFVRYSVWLIYQIVLANLHVIRVALSPKLMTLINPKMIHFTTTLKSERAKFLLATSITLTPGTVTVRIDEDTFMVHALTDHTAKGCPGDMERRVAAVFGETY